jgi:hypothetical protein
MSYPKVIIHRIGRPVPSMAARRLKRRRRAIRLVLVGVLLGSALLRFLPAGKSTLAELDRPSRTASR